MRKIVIFSLCSVLITLCYLTFITAKNVINSDWEMPQEVNIGESKMRIVLITQDLETPFWDKVANGAKLQAKENGVSLEVWGSYGNNEEDFLKKIDIAIHSKVDGIIVQGLDTEEFIDMTKIKAGFYGVPIITVANDVPMTESLRKTYVGSDQYIAGKLIAKQLIRDMGPSGELVLLYDNLQEYYQVERLRGIQETLKNYPDVTIVHAETPNTREHIITTTQDVLNRVPNAQAFIAVNAKVAGPMVQEISRRFQVDPLFIYSFDDGPETLSLLTQGKIDAIIEQEPEKMGEISVEKLLEWLKGETVPLNIDGYFTEINVLKAKDLP
ncbi:substrate-binding domain-containing protein [Bacillus salitolerans]|uniref:Substrate-binding domain-containing protein n=1 Tax=Bacillus salitolerans TaxID=1437434 RepID=A0ABW4LXE7_9BACI